ncbi:hypothetical protein [Pseudoblastomonas halimionae]|uniref:DUF2946 domain-containing protein n=1 Tax=Alteriqipengyuania halimionae TaxID=1926630 RepID=A0A6I4U422_9SPHN|nr:hypothetical protein [Alteriqipengyuania halimionae]MXP09212.1 hypothetical protein [Alteriqipengyuania halimionae]
MFFRRSSSQRFFAIAALVAMLQLAIPHGWMVAAAANGTPTLVPCPTVSPDLAALATGSPSAHDHTPDPHAAHGEMHAMPSHDAGMAMAHGDHGPMAHAMAHGDPMPMDHAMAAEDSPDAQDAHGDHDPESGLAKAMCDLAALAAPATLPAPPLLDLPLPASPEIVLTPIRTVFPGRGLAAPPPPSTGPPTLS